MESWDFLYLQKIPENISKAESDEKKETKHLTRQLLWSWRATTRLQPTKKIATKHVDFSFPYELCCSLKTIQINSVIFSYNMYNEISISLFKSRQEEILF